MDHKFCIVAAGDYPNTGKYVEAIIFASRGGCVPVFIGVSPRSLAFGSVIDYRRVALWSGVSSLGSNLDLWRRWSAEQVRPMMEYARTVGKLLDYDAEGAEQALREVCRRVRSRHRRRRSSATDH